MDTLRWILLIVGLLVIAGVYVWTRRQARRNGDHLPVDLGHIEDTPLDRHGGEPHISDVDPDVFDQELAGLGRIVAEQAAPPESDVAVRLDAQDRQTHTPPPAAQARRPEPAAPPKAARSVPPAPAAEPEESVRSAPAEEPAAPARDGAPRPPTQDEKIVALFVVAPRGQRFRGPAVTRALTDAGLQFGAMDIYHRYPRQDSAAEPVFSVANLVDPGTLDPAAMDDFVTPGLSLFMRLPGPMAGVQALDDLVATARRLADNLDGELRDQTRSVLSRQTIEALREEVVEFERRASIRQA